MATALASSKNGGASPLPAKLLPREPLNEPEEPQQSSLIVYQIPDILWKPAEEEIKNYVHEQLTICEGERGPMIGKFARWKEAYDAPLATSPKNFPIHNASNIEVALIKEHAHTIIGQLAQSTLTAKPRVIFEDLDPDWEPFIDPLERFLDTAAEREWDFDDTMVDVIDEMSILGTSIVEMAHEVKERRVYRYTADGKSVYPKTVVFRDGPKLNRIPLGSFWIRMFEKDPNEARWCATRHLFSDMELREKEALGKFYGVERILSPDGGDDQEEPSKAAEDRVLDQTTTRTDRHEVFKIWLSWDIDKDGRYEELVLWYHRESGTFIGRQFLSNWSGKRNLVKFGYFPRTDRFYWEGLAEMLEQIQIAVSAIVNRRADNATLANLKMIIKRKIMKNLQPGDPLYSGKIIEANDIWNDVREFSLSDIYPSTISEEQILRDVANRLSGMNEAAAGAAMPVTRTTAAAQLALLQEQRNRIGLTISNIRKGVRDIGLAGMELYSQHGTNGKAIAWLGEKGRVVEAIFRLPRRVTELGLGLKASAPTSTQNKQVKRENMLAMFNLTVQMYEQILPLAQHLAPDHLPEIARGLVKSARRFMEDALETFEEISDPADVLEGLIILERVLPAAENFGGLETFDRREEASALNDKLSRMEDLLREAEATRDRESRSRPGNERARRTAPPERGIGGGAPGFLFGGAPLLRSRGG